MPKLRTFVPDFLHKLSTRLTRENQTIVLEDLNVSGMVKNRKLSRAISDLGWRTFRTMLEYKCNKYGREFQVIDRWEPTSQKCSHCGFRGGKKELDVREWVCLNCGTLHDRDLNAALNILSAGNAILKPIVEPTPVITKQVTNLQPLLNHPVQLDLFQEVAEGQPETNKKRTRRSGKSTRKKVARSSDVSTLLEFGQQLSLFD